MSNPYIGEIRLFAGNFAPAGWFKCDGSLISIAEYDTLFALIGTTYGGDGQSTFAVPDLRGRVPIHQGQGPGLQSYQPGESGGVEDVTLTTGQIPTHTHPLSSAAAGSTIANDPNPAGNVPGESSLVSMYQAGNPGAAMAAAAVANTGSSQAHDNMQPYMCVMFIIAWQGIFPSQT